MFSMKSFFAAASFVLLSVCHLSAQESTYKPAVSSTVPATARYEILQTNPNGRSTAVTFNLDKYTGRVFNLSTCPQRSFVGVGLCWKEMVVLELPKAAGDSTPRYQIFAHGEGGRSILLINVVTGQTWQYGVDGPDKWTPLLETVVLPQSFEVVK
jgi:hypothetical protein